MAPVALGQLGQRSRRARPCARGVRRLARAQVGDWEAAAPFAAGGCGGLLYQFSLQAGVDVLPSPHEVRRARLRQGPRTA